MRFILAATAILALAGCASDRRAVDPALLGPRTSADANPSAIVVAELAFARAAQLDGQWTAFRDTAADTAVMLDPTGPVRAAEFLKGRADPAQAVSWQPHRVMMACDGRTGASTGPWQRADGLSGSYTTVWQRQDRNARKPNWKWVLDYGASASSAGAADAELAIIASDIASCKGNAKAAAIARTSVIAETGALPPAAVMASEDGTFLWSWTRTGDKSMTVTIELWNGTGYDTVLTDHIGAQAP